MGMDGRPMVIQAKVICVLTRLVMSTMDAPLLLLVIQPIPQQNSWLPAHLENRSSPPTPGMY